MHLALKQNQNVTRLLAVENYVKNKQIDISWIPKEKNKKEVTTTMTGPHKLSECLASQYNTKQFFLIYCKKFYQLPILNMSGHFHQKG